MFTNIRKWQLGPSGGLSYHLSALRYRNTLWRPFLNQVDEWLNSTWNPQVKDLVIFGSSAGWTLPFSFLDRFEKITIVDPDRWATAIFRQRFAALESRLEVMNRADLLPWFDRAPGHNLQDFLETKSDAAILFSNVLGQIPLLLNKSDLNEKKFSKNQIFLSRLDGRNWASYHDLWSSHATPLITRPPQILNELINGLDLHSPAPERLAEILALYFPAGSEVVDHETLWLSALAKVATPTTIWQIRPGYSHVIGFVSSSGPRSEPTR